MLGRLLVSIGLFLGLSAALAEAANTTREWKATFARAGGDELRLALVIGNSAYPTAPLANPANDAALIAETLNQVGFAVTQIIDADQRAMKKAISAFGERLNLAGENTVGLFYYAGHGIQARGRNFLIPVDAAIKSEADLGIYGVSAQELLGTMEFAGNRMNIVIMDACRNNPYKRSFRSAANGLAQMRAPSGSLLAFATAPGEVAADGSGANSPYTLALTREIQVDGQELGTVFKRVAAALKKQSKGDQVPWIQSSITGDFYFKGTVAAEETISPTPGGTTQPATAAPAAPTADKELVFWQSLMNSTNPALYESYLQQYPKGAFAPLAAAKIAELKGGQQQAAAPSTDNASTKQRTVSSDPNTDAITRPSMDTVAGRMAIQRDLRIAGYRVGMVDGDIGPTSEAAIARFRSDRGLGGDGALTAREIEVLTREATSKLISGAAQVQPTFGCEDVRLPHERLLCSDSDLASREIRLAEVYFGYRYLLTPDEKAKASERNRAWTRRTVEKCGINDASILRGSAAREPARRCLTLAYKARMRDLRAATTRLRNTAAGKPVQ